MRFAHALLITLLFTAAVLAQAQPALPEPAIGKVEDVYLARDNGEGKVGDIVEDFNTRDTRIHCVVMLTSFDPTPVKMLLVAVKVPGVRPESKIVTAAYTTKKGQDRVFFSGSADGKWVPGMYRIDIFVADKKERSVTFEIKGNADPATSTKFVPTKPTKRRN